jgi:hypothetical protein
MNAPGDTHDTFESSPVPQNHTDLLMRLRRVLLALGASHLHHSMQLWVMNLCISHMKFQDLSFWESSLPWILNILTLYPAK